MLLSPYIKTLALLLHAAGPAAVYLPQMTSELWDLLLSVRTTASSDSLVLESLLFALLTLLEVNEDKQMLVRDHSKELLETQEWAELVFERIEGTDEEGSRAKMLAASLLLQCRKIVSDFQRLLMGDLE